MTDRNEAVLEQALTPDEALEFLKDENNFRNAANGIRDWFAEKHPDVNAEKLDRAFRKAMRTSLLGDCPDVKTISKWLNGETLPEKRNAIKICFALGLSGSEANEFLFRVCRLNGINFRKVEDVVCAYCLDNLGNGKTYADVERLMDRYNEATKSYAPEVSDSTKRTRHLQSLFSELDKMQEDEFFELLCDNKNNFIGYNLSSQRLFNELYDGITSRLKKDIAEYNHDAKELYKNDGGGYPEKDITVLSEIVFDNLVQTLFGAVDNEGKPIVHPNLDKKPILKEITDNFPRAQYITAMREDAKSASEGGYSRKTYILLFFANEVFKQEKALEGKIGGVPPKTAFYKNFYMKLNGDLFDCGFGLLYAADPFDWLILNCVCALDANELEYDTLQLFNDLLRKYVKRK